MAYIPDICFSEAKNDLLSESGVMKHAALTLFAYFCLRRNRETGLCRSTIAAAARDTGIPRGSVVALCKFLEEKDWILVSDTGEIRLLKGFYSTEEILQLKRIRRPNHGE